MSVPRCQRILVCLTLWMSACGTATQSASIPSTSAPGAPAPAAALPSDRSASPHTVAASSCAPTLGDALSPSYKPGAPVRSVVRQGHVVSGVVRSSDVVLEPVKP